MAYLVLCKKTHILINIASNLLGQKVVVSDLSLLHLTCSWEQSPTPRLVPGPRSESGDLLLFKVWSRLHVYRIKYTNVVSLFLFYWPIETNDKVQLVLLWSITEGSLKVKLPTIRTDDKHSQEEAEPGRNSDVEKVRREKTRDGESQKRKDAGARKGRKIGKHCVFPVDADPNAPGSKVPHQGLCLGPGQSRGIYSYLRFGAF